MAGFLKRLGWYLVGFSIGIVFLVFFLKKKSGGEGVDFCYLPNCRVLKDIRSKPFIHKKATSDTLYFNDLDADTQNVLLHGDIDFNKSDTKSEPCKTYHIVHENNKVALTVANCPDKATIVEIHLIKP